MEVWLGDGRGVAEGTEDEEGNITEVGLGVEVGVDVVPDGVGVGLTEPTGGGGGGGGGGSWAKIVSGITIPNAANIKTPGEKIVDRFIFFIIAQY